MKVIYMQDTISIMWNKQVESLIASGEVKKSEQGVNYLVINVEEEEEDVE